MPVDSIKTDASIMAALGRQMTRAVQRETLASSNLANIDTPGYRAREASFEAALGSSTGLSMQATDSKHLSAPAIPGSPTVKENADMSAQRNGNNVQLDRELLELNRAMGDFSSAQTVLAAKFRLVRYAINDGR
ncbi:MAG: flagellar basal body rod protein FlgB [Acidobacteriota bacterium]